MGILDQLLGGAGAVTNPSPNPDEAFDPQRLLEVIRQRMAAEGNQQQPPTQTQQPAPVQAGSTPPPPAATTQVAPQEAIAPPAAQPRPQPTPQTFTPPAQSWQERLGAVMAGGGDRQQGLIARIGGMLGAGPQYDERKQTENQTVAALMQRGNYTQEQATAIARNPHLLQAVAPVAFGAKTPVTHGIIGTDPNGSNVYGLIDPANRTATPFSQIVTGAPGAQNPLAPSNQPHVTGQAYLDTLQPALRARIVAMGEGREPPPQGRAAITPQGAAILNHLASAYPGFDMTRWNAANRTQTQFAAGPQGNNLTAIGTAISHLGTLSSRISELGNSSFTPYNSVANPVSEALGDSRVNNFRLARDAVADELERAFRGTGGSVSGIENWRRSINEAQSPQQLNDAVREAARLLQGRHDELLHQYRTGIGNNSAALPDAPGGPSISPNALAALERFRTQGTSQTRDELHAQINDALAARRSGNTQQPSPPQASQPQEGDTATNSTTGERRVFRGGRWQPLTQ